VSKSLSGIWAEEPGLQVDVVDEERLVYILGFRTTPNNEREEVSRITLSLPNRRAAVGEAILPPADRVALRIGRNLLAILAEARKEGGR
jgi:hypothetical protein